MDPGWEKIPTAFYYYYFYLFAKGELFCECGSILRAVVLAQSWAASRSAGVEGLHRAAQAQITASAVSY